MSDKIKLRVNIDNIIQKVSNLVTSWSNNPSDSSYPSEKLVKDSLDGKANTSHSQASNTITETSALGRIGTSANANQHEINLAINNLINASGGGGNDSLVCVSDYYFDSEDEEIVLEYCTGKLISSITKSTNGLTDTYTITYSDNTTYEFTVTNGSNGNVTVDSTWVDNSTNPVQSNVIKSALDSKQDVLTSGTTIKTINNQSILGSGNITISGGSGGNDGENIACITDFYLDNTDPTDLELVIDSCTGKLISSITKSTNGLTDTYTINYTDSTNYQFTVTNGSDGNVTVDSSWVANSTNPVQSQLVKSALDNKSDTGHTHSAYVNPTVVDNLTSDSSTSVLSAKQGKILNDKIGDITTFFNGSG